VAPTEEPDSRLGLEPLSQWLADMLSPQLNALRQQQTGQAILHAQEISKCESRLTKIQGWLHRISEDGAGASIDYQRLWHLLLHINEQNDIAQHRLANVEQDPKDLKKLMGQKDEEGTSRGKVWPSIEAITGSRESWKSDFDRMVADANAQNEWKRKERQAQEMLGQVKMSKGVLSHWNK
jgi:hypothetical protein